MFIFYSIFDHIVFYYLRVICKSFNQKLRQSRAEKIVSCLLIFSTTVVRTRVLFLPYTKLTQSRMICSTVITIFRLGYCITLPGCAIEVKLMREMLKHWKKDEMLAVQTQWSLYDVYDSIFFFGITYKCLNHLLRT